MNRDSYCSWDFVFDIFSLRSASPTNGAAPFNSCQKRSSQMIRMAQPESPTPITAVLTFSPAEREGILRHKLINIVGTVHSRCHSLASLAFLDAHLMKLYRVRRPFPNSHVEHLYRNRKSHGKIDIPPRNVEIESFRDHSYAVRTSNDNGDDDLP